MQILKFCILTFIIVLAGSWCKGQESGIYGYVFEYGNGNPIPYVNITIDSSKGITTGNDGKYNIALEPGTHLIEFSFIGFHRFSLEIIIPENEFLEVNVEMKPEVLELEQTVITAGRHEQRISDISVSTMVMKPEFLEQTNSYSMEQGLERLPGIDIIDGQASIRGGSGWSYGAGSRVLVLLDDIPLMSADAADAKWNFYPVEDLSQVEIIKGASSALYGSSALNGIINIRTAWPGSKPATSIKLFSGAYLPPARKELIWWRSGYPVYGGGSFSHLQQKGNFDLGISGNITNNPGYRKDNYEKTYRLNLKLRHRDQKVKGLNYGIKASIMHLDLIDFFLWQDADSGAWMQNPEAITTNRGLRLYVDPFVNFFTTGGSKHSLKMRFFRTFNEIVQDASKNNKANQYLAEYQYSKHFGSLNFTAGATYIYSASVANLFGSHFSNNAAIFAQADKQWDKFSATLGVRLEQFRLDSTTSKAKPVFRSGITWHPAKHSHLRASFGQGYRFPSIAEKYTSTSVGGINIFPNPRIASETGWSAELGIRQGFVLSSWMGYIDVAAYWTEYQDMMEFVFDFYDTLTYLPTKEYFTLDNMGFQSQNIGLAQIKGIDLIIGGSGSIFGLPANIMLGYTYMDPVDLNTDSAYRASKSSDNNYLKYRYLHSFKSDFDISINKLNAGLSMIYHSYMINVDQIFVDPVLGAMIMPGYADYRESHKSGSFRIDLRMSYKFSGSVSLSMFCKNLLNRENIGRPGDIHSSGEVAMQLIVTF